MHRTRILSALAILALGTGAVAGPAAHAVVEPPQSRSAPELSAPSERGIAALDPERLPFVPGELLVRFKAGVGPERRLRAVRAQGARMARRIPRFGVNVVRLPRGASVARSAQRFRAHPAVAHAEPNLYRLPAAVPNDPLFFEQWGLLNEGQEHRSAMGSTVSGTPGADIKAPQAWEVEQGRPEVVIAVIDSGTDISHPDLAGKIWVNENEVPDGTDTDGNGYVDDINGWDFAENNNSVFEPDSTALGFDHGTHVAGIIGAATDNEVGVAGVCPNCRIMPLKIMRPIFIDMTGDGRLEKVMAGDLASELEALEYALANGARIVNASFGSNIIWSQIAWQAYRRLSNQGVLAVIAAGNTNGDNDLLVLEDWDGDGVPDIEAPSYPATHDHPGILSVAASNHHDQYGFFTDCPLPPNLQWRCAFTNWGNSSVDLAAPGVDVIGPVPEEGYEHFDGTSMAAPYVAGVAGLLMSKNPSWTSLQVKQALLSSVDRPAGLSDLRGLPQAVYPRTPASRNFTATSGRLNAAAALALTVPPPVVHNRRHDNISRARWLGNGRSGRLAWPHNINHVYKKRLMRGRRYRIILRGPLGEDFDLQVWRPVTREIWQIEEGCLPGLPGRCVVLRQSAEVGTARERVTFRAPRTGVFYMHVNAWITSRGPYTLTARRCTRRAPRC